MAPALSSRILPQQQAPLGQLTPRQSWLLVGWAILLWLAAALFIRTGPAALFARGALTAALFAAALPVGWLTAVATRRHFSLRADQLVIGVALCSASAMLCDGIALTWSGLYGSGQHPLVGAAWLLWGVGIILVSAFIQARPAPA